MLCAGVIIPTCFDYVNKIFGAPEWFYGLTLAAISISNFFVGPLMGAIYDYTHRPKMLVLFLNLFEIGGSSAIVCMCVPENRSFALFFFIATGNMMYFTATSKWMVLGSRLITGE